MKDVFAVVRNDRGLCEKNYLLTKEDLKKFALNNGVCDNEEINTAIERAVDGIGFETIYLQPNDTLNITYIDNDRLRLVQFLKGYYNTDIIEMIVNNYDTKETPKDNINAYNEWYYTFEEDESSTEIIDELKTDDRLRNLLQMDYDGPSDDYIYHILLDAFDEDSEEYKAIKAVV